MQQDPRPTGGGDSEKLQDRKKYCQEISIPYDQIKLLARGKVTTGPISSDLSLIGTGASLVTLLAGTVTSGTTKKWLIGSPVGAGIFAFALYERSRRRQNYIAVFFSTQAHQCAGNSSADSNPAPGANSHAPKKDSNNLFECAKGCEIAIFKIRNPHDYWNISMILNATTGLEFVSEAAERQK